MPELDGYHICIDPTLPPDLYGDVEAFMQAFEDGRLAAEWENRIRTNILNDPKKLEDQVRQLISFTAPHTR